MTLASEAIPVAANTPYDLQAFMRGEMDAEGGMGYVQLRAYYYDGSGAYLSYQTAVTRTDDTLTTTWEEGGGQVTTPANAASVRIYLYNFSSSGWAALDNVRLSRPNGATIQRSTYGLAGQMVATRVSGDPVGGNNGLFFFYGDHLGSSRLLVTSSNGVVAGSRTWYLPFGGYRGTSPTQAISDRDFTGQKENREVGLLYYNARYYVPGIGRFASADTIVPNPANPQSWNRYSYVRNSPLNMTDPTGHRECESDNYCGPLPHSAPPPSPSQPSEPISTVPIDRPIVTFDAADDCVGDCTWSQEEMDTILASATATGTRLAETLNATHGWNLSASDAFLLVYGGSVNFQKMGVACAQGCWGRSTGRNNIEVYTNIVDDGGVNRLIGDEHWAVHELGHSFVNAVGSNLPLKHYEQLQRVGFANRGVPGGCDDPIRCGFAGGQWEWQRSAEGTTSEEFADMYLGWVYGQWERDDFGNLTTNGYQRSIFMNHFMPMYIDMAVNP